MKLMVATDTGREQAVELLRGAYVDGQFGPDTFNRRLDLAFAAQSDAELHRVVQDIPVAESFRQRLEAFWERHFAALVSQEAGPGFAMTIRARRPGLANGESVVVGRGDNAHLQLDHETVSRTHARLSSDEHSLVIEDLGSLNGTWINGWRIDRPYRLAPGDELILGRVRLVLS